MSAITMDPAYYLIRVYFICDTSGSMQGVRLIALNRAINHALNQLQLTTTSLKVRVYINAIRYAATAEWHCSDQLLELSTWKIIEQAEGLSQLGQAYRLLASRLKLLSETAFDSTTILVLLSDGKPTDNYKPFLQSLLNTRMGQEAIRLSFGIGKDADQVSLKRFSGEEDVPIVSSMKQLKQELTQALEYAVQLGYIRALKSLRLLA